MAAGEISERKLLDHFEKNRRLTEAPGSLLVKTGTECSGSSPGGGIVFQDTVFEKRMASFMIYLGCCLR